jgi:2-(1,2-epoxy-1,2-dihydrophenyl)acetyl-CoA isomerase
LAEHHALYDVTDGVATITFNRPEVLNAFDDVMRQDLIDYTYQAERDSKVRCLVLKGAGRAFMAGGDVKGLNHDIRNNRDAHLAQWEMRVVRTHQIIYQIRRMEKPVVAAVQGPCAGLGLGLAIAADVCIARDDALFVMAYRNIGLTADGGASYYLPRLLGERRALQMALFGESIKAPEAKEMGLVNWVVAEDEFDGFVDKAVKKLATGPTKALGRVKTLMRNSLQTTWDEASHRECESIRYAGETKDHSEGVLAFVEKRKPKFTGE